MSFSMVVKTWWLILYPHLRLGFASSHLDSCLVLTTKSPYTILSNFRVLDKEEDQAQRTMVGCN